MSLFVYIPEISLIALHIVYQHNFGFLHWNSLLLSDLLATFLNFCFTEVGTIWKYHNNFASFSRKTGCFCQLSWVVIVRFFFCSRSSFIIVRFVDRTNINLHQLTVICCPIGRTRPAPKLIVNYHLQSGNKPNIFNVTAELLMDRDQKSWQYTMLRFAFGFDQHNFEFSIRGSILMVVVYPFRGFEFQSKNLRLLIYCLSPVKEHPLTVWIRVCIARKMAISNWSVVNICNFYVGWKFGKYNFPLKNIIQFRISSFYIQKNKL